MTRADRSVGASPRLGRMALALAAALTLLLIPAAAILYAGRLELARRAALAWVRSRGVEADVRFTALGPAGLTARVRIGPAAHPDLVVDQATVSYSLKSFLAGKGLDVSAVRLDRPVLTGEWRRGRLSLGAVDRLIATLKPAPGAPAAPLPRIAVRGGVVRLATDYGPVAVSGDADIAQGKLDRLDAVLAPTILRQGELSATVGAVALKASRSGDRMQLGLRAEAPTVVLARARVEQVTLEAQADLSYAALEKGRIEGRATAGLQASSAMSGGLSAGRLRLDAQSTDVTLDPARRTGAGGFHLRAALGEAAAAGARLLRTQAEGSGSFMLKAGVPTVRFAGSASGEARSKALGSPAKDDAPVMTAVKRGLADFHWSVARAEVSLEDGQVRGRLLGPVRAASATGGTISATPVGAGYRLRMAGGGLPDASADVRDVRVSQGGISARASARAAFSLGILDHAEIAGAGVVSARGAALSFVPAACAQVKARRLDFGANSAEGFSAEACPGERPMLTVSPDRWTIAARVRGAAAKVPAFEVGLAEGAGAMTLQGHGADVSADMTVDSVRATDLARPLRFRPVLGSGHAALEGDIFFGGFDARTPGGAAIAHADFRQQVTEMKGAMTVSVPALVFAPGKLQPTDLSPLTAALGEPATGQVSFQGRFDWDGDKVKSAGTLSARDLNFRSPVGPVTGFSGDMDFTSLAPLVGASRGPLRAARIAALVPLTDVSARARIDDQTATVSDAQGSVGGGLVKLNATASLAADQTVTGEVVMDSVQVHDLVQSSPFSDKVSMTAELSGRLPFQSQGGKLRFSEGKAMADGPGRLSISRKVFEQGVAEGVVAQNNLATFGYQALENLAFDTLEASIRSLPDGKLGMLFHIKGRHDPPTRQELRLTWRDLFDRNVLNKPMPLPSGTEVNLTLDTTLNLDNLIQSYAELHRQFGSPPVQPAQATLRAETSENPR